MVKEKTLKIIRLTAENFKRIVAVEIEPTPDGSIVVIAGKNAQGKSSVLDAIMAVLCGARKVPEMALRAGTDEGFVRVHLGDYEVERTFKLGEDGEPLDSKLTVRTAEGGKYSSPQQLLDDVVGRISFDPLAFVRMEPKDQVAELVRVADVKLDLDEWDANRRGKFDARTDANREVKKLAARAEKMPYHDEVPDNVRPLTAVAQELKEAQERNFARRRNQQQYDTHQYEIKRLKELAAALKPALQKEEDVAPLEVELAAAEATNIMANANRNRAAVLDEAEISQKLADELTAGINSLDVMRSQALAHAELPVDGLSFDVDGVKLDDVPFNQCALSEQLMVSTAVAMAANPTLRVILIRDGSLLDADGRAALERLARANDYQVWFECVDGDVGFQIHEGRVVAEQEAK